MHFRHFLQVFQGLWKITFTYRVPYTAGVSQMRDKYDRIIHTFEEYVCVKFKIDSNPNADISFVFSATS